MFNICCKTNVHNTKCFFLIDFNDIMNTKYRANHHKTTYFSYLCIPCFVGDYFLSSWRPRVQSIQFTVDFLLKQLWTTYFHNKPLISQSSNIN